LFSLGHTRWRAAKDVADLIPAQPGMVAQYLPRLSYLLIEEHQ